MSLGDSSIGDYLPNNIEIEKVLLGALLNKNSYVEDVIDFLRPNHFFLPLHQKIYELILKIVDSGGTANPITIKNYFNNDDVFLESKIKPFDYLIDITYAANIVINVVEFAVQVTELATRRDIIDIAEKAINKAKEENSEISSLDRVEYVEQKLFNLAFEGVQGSNFAPIEFALKSAINKVEDLRSKKSNISGVTTGFYEIDDITSGLQDSDLIIIAARPSMGKTSLAINIAINCANYFKSIDKSVGFVSLEMSSEQVATRMLSIQTGISGNKIRSGHIGGPDEFRNLTSASAEISKYPIFIDDTPALSISSIRTRARRMRRRNNLGLLIVDYLQLIKATIGSRDVNRVQEISEISQGLKAIAKELKIPVIALSQLSRAVELREDKRPMLSDLRESGSIEQDADIVIFIYREEYYLDRRVPIEEMKNAEWQERMNKVRNHAEIIIAKQRNGPVGTKTIRFDSATTNFTNLY